MSAVYDSTDDTLEHIGTVRGYLAEVIADLGTRSVLHDASKLQEPEKSVFDRETPRLRKITYGSDEYRASLARLGEALQHHYQENRHHPEHHRNGIRDMNLLDVVEMLVDWAAAVQRHDNGDITRSIAVNQDRFGYSDELRDIFLNTARYLGWIA